MISHPHDSDRKACARIWDFANPYAPPGIGNTSTEQSTSADGLVSGAARHVQARMGRASPCVQISCAARRNPCPSAVCQISSAGPRDTPRRTVLSDLWTDSRDPRRRVDLSLAAVWRNSWARHTDTSRRNPRRIVGTSDATRGGQCGMSWAGWLHRDTHQRQSWCCG